MQVKPVANLLALLEFFAQRQSPASLSDIAKHFDWPRSSTHNLIGTLLAQGYLYEPDGSKNYYPSSLWQQHIDRISAAAPLPDAALQLLHALVQHTQETVVLAGISGQKALFLAAQESPHAVRYTAQVGKTVPLHATATGRALLAQMPHKQREQLLRQAHFERHTNSTLMSVQAVEEEIARSQVRGYFIGAAEYSQDLGGIALPLPLQGRQLAILVAGPLARMQGRLDELAQVMRQEVAVYCEAEITPAQANP